MGTPEKSGGFLETRFFELAIVDVDFVVFFHVFFLCQYPSSGSFKPPHSWLELVDDVEGFFDDFVCLVKVAHPFCFCPTEFGAWRACCDDVEVVWRKCFFAVPVEYELQMVATMGSIMFFLCFFCSKACL